jgi:hypothetical protein
MKKYTEGVNTVRVTGWVPPEAAAAGEGRSGRKDVGCLFPFFDVFSSRPPFSRSARLRLAPNPRKSLTGISSWILMEPHGEQSGSNSR